VADVEASARSLASHTIQINVLGSLPAILNPAPGISNAGSVVGSVLTGIALLAVLGIRARHERTCAKEEHT
jgi:hypothetical protein